MAIDWAIAKWNAPIWVKAFTTSRSSGASMGAYASNNLSLDVGDSDDHVHANREKLAAVMGRRVPFLELEHGTRIIEINSHSPEDLAADAAIIRTPGCMVGILTADCLPVFISNRQGTVAALAHVGWRGLAGGIIEKVVSQLNEPPSQLTVFIGPCIHAFGFLVGKDVYDAMMALDPDLRQFFTPSRDPDHAKKAHCDLPAIAKHRLKKREVTDIHQHSADTFRSPDEFYSYRRSHVTGRMASVLHLVGDDSKPIASKKGVSMRDLDQRMVADQAKKAQHQTAMDLDLDI